MRIGGAAAVALAILSLLALAPSASASEGCEAELRVECFEIESLSASLSTTQAGAHPDLSFRFRIAEDPETKPDVKGTRDGYAPTRNVRTELPPGLIGDPNALGGPQQCEVAELTLGECPNGSQIGLIRADLHNIHLEVTEPLYMMTPPGGDVLARVGFVPGVPAGAGVYADVSVRSESDYGLTTEIFDSLYDYTLIEAEATLWGVPADHSHDTERCTPTEVYENGCTESPPRPAGSRPLPFLTNPTRCGVPLQMTVAASSWVEPERYDTKTAEFPQVTGCNKLPFGPSVAIEPTSHRTFAPSGLDLTMTLPKAEGVEVLEPAQIRDIRIDLPEGVTVNPGSADGLGVCSVAQVHFKERVASECPDSAKMAATEFEIGGLSRRMKGAIYLREPEPGNLFRIWVVADDLGAHVKLAGQLEVDKATGQLRSVLLENPQAPLREVKLLFKSGFRAPLMTPKACGTYFSHYEFTPWSGGPAKVGDTSMEIDEGCQAGGFSPKLVAGSTDARAGAFSPFSFTIHREDPEENIAGLNVTLPKGMAASFAGVGRCEGAAAETGECPADSRIGKIVAADGAGPNPLWVPQPGKDPTAIYLSGPYKGAPLSIVAVVPAQAGPFDLGNQVVRSAIYVDSETAQATAVADPLPQIIEGIPVTYKTVNAQLDRPGFSLNPTSCAAGKRVEAHLTSTGGKTADPAYPYAASDCARLGFEPQISARIFGPTHRGYHPRFRAVVKMPSGGANLAGTQVTLPKSEFLDQGHFVTICTRVQFRAHECPAGATYGHVTARSPLFDFPLEGDVLLRSSDRTLPDLVFVLRGPAWMPVEVAVAGHVDSVKGALRTTFENVPDAPVSEVTVEMAGGSKGLLQNTEGVCAPNNRLRANFSAQNGRRLTTRPKLQAGCKGKHRKHKRRHKRHG